MILRALGKIIRFIIGAPFVVLLGVIFFLLYCMMETAAWVLEGDEE